MHRKLFKPTVVTNLLIINLLFYIATDMMSSEVATWMYRNMGLYFWESEYFQPHQFLTHIFMHGGFMHLFTNMFALWMFGRALEYNLGSKRFLAYYLICGVGAGLMQMGVTWIEISGLKEALETTGSYIAEANLLSRLNVVTVGASGAVFGILLGFGLMFPNSIIMLLFPPIPMKAKYFVIIYGLLELWLGISGTQSGIAHFAHVGGMLWGLMLLLWWRKNGKVSFSLGFLDRIGKKRVTYR